ncbi:hypothetical protein [Bdellovibrio bacteriovorus]|uniref:Shikimate dehydrogenase (NADP(+)) n=1 Tax=Bdellovibrio bacteriovorus str. Tiberius TaxID=1069642 RepID=K7YU73_BDEBC|nr:hypothetical protein [Bdellovibrio bacteriovorus]AFY01193.1 hypothetical protein Bdt_1497 [Bdellovibrio bacteriovorus str. Tiberius]
MSILIREIRADGTPGQFMRFMQALAGEKGWDWQFETVTEFSREVFQGAAAVKVASALSAEILPQMKVLPTQVRAVQVLDTFFPEDGSWYPRVLLHEALRMVLVAEARDLDIRAPAFVIGHSEEARVVASVLALMGISDIYLVGESAGLEEHQQALMRSHLGIHFHILPIDELTMQAVSAGIVVNTVDLSGQQALLTDLSYFNYMKGTGYALDLNLLSLQNLLLEEAEKAELRVLHPVLVAEALTRLWLERLRPEHNLSHEDIRESWTRFLKQNSSSV